MSTDCNAKYHTAGAELVRAHRRWEENENSSEKKQKYMAVCCVVIHEHRGYVAQREDRGSNAPIL